MKKLPVAFGLGLNEVFEWIDYGFMYTLTFFSLFDFQLNSNYCVFDRILILVGIPL